MSTAATQQPSTPASNDTLATVLALAGKGWRLFPCLPRSKKPCIKEWPTLATTDPEQLRTWAHEHPGCNWALATGPASGVWAMDCDVKPCPSCPPETRKVNGASTLKNLMAQHGALPLTLITVTHHGNQYLFKYPSDRTIRNENAGKKLGDGLDIRGDGGYVMVPPSVHPVGSPYRFADADAELANAPEWLIRMAEGAAPPTEQHPANNSDCIPKGKGEPAKFSCAIKLLKAGYSRDVALGAVLALDARCEHQLGRDECARKVGEWADRYARGGRNDTVRATAR